MLDNEASATIYLPGRQWARELSPKTRFDALREEISETLTVNIGDQSPLVALSRSCITKSTSPFFSITVSDCSRFSYAARTNEANSGCALSGFDLYSGWN